LAPFGGFPLEGAGRGRRGLCRNRRGASIRRGRLRHDAALLGFAFDNEVQVELSALWWWRDARVSLDIEGGRPGQGGIVSSLGLLGR